MTLYHIAEHQRRVSFTWELFGYGYRFANEMALEVLRFGNVAPETIRHYLDEIKPYHGPPDQNICDNMVLGERLFRLYHTLKFVKSDSPCNAEYVCRLFAWNQELIALNRYYDNQIGKPIPDIYRLYPDEKESSYIGSALFLLRKGIFKSLPYLAAMEGAHSCLCRPMVRKIDCRNLPTHNSLTVLAFALEIYKSENNGDYPEDLNSLIGFGLSSIPTDPYTDGKPFRYPKNDEGGYVIYSIGPNGIDNNGFEDYNRKADDIAVQMP